MEKKCKHEWEPTDSQGRSMECIKCGKQYDMAEKVLLDEAIERAFKNNPGIFKGYCSTPEIRKEILENLAKLWEMYPSMRFGQLLENFVFGHHSERKGCIFHVYDEDTLNNIKKALK